MSLVKVNKTPTVFDPWNGLFDVEDFFSPLWPSKVRSNYMPAVNISEDNKTYFVDLVVPGFKKEDFKVNVENDTLVISAETEHEAKEEGNNKQYTRREYSYSSFTRSFKLPDNAQDDAISANYKDGVLKLSIPKSEQQVKATKEVKVS